MNDEPQGVTAPDWRVAGDTLASKGAVMETRGYDVSAQDR